jgi:hypothetical protein
MEFLNHWTPDTFESSTHSNFIKSRINTVANISSIDNSGKCTYTYNELGFRGDSIYKEGPKVMSIGCSLTEGIGVNDNETWSKVFCDLIGGVNLNFGLGGRSNDYIARSLLTHYDLVKPDIVLIMYTVVNRKEIHTKDNGVEPFIPTHSWGYLKDTADGRTTQEMMVSLQNDYEDYTNWYKNHLLIKNFLDNKKTKWLWNGETIFIDYQDANRFDGGIRPFIDLGSDNTHPGPLTHKRCGEKTYEYITKNNLL